jgi:putative tryptophan/tyrosine transport system substrate-binding protein
MRRREFITSFGSSVVAWPLTTRAQQAAMPVIGFVYFGSSETITSLIAAFRNGLAETGYFEGQNVKMEYRWAQYQPDRLPEIMAELVRRQVAVIATPGAVPSLAAKAATATIPIVFGEQT